MKEPSDQPHADQLGEISDEFVAKCRLGEKPRIADYCERYPNLADDIRELLPSLQMLEDLRPVESDRVSSDSSEEDGITPTDRLGDYRIIGEVGRGGMGIVYEAEQISLGRRVAVKILPKFMNSNATVRERFEREALVSANLHHTNVVPVFGIGRDGSTPYIVMQLVQGASIDEVIDKLQELHRSHNRSQNENDIASHLSTFKGDDSSGSNRSMELAKTLLTRRFGTADSFSKSSGTLVDDDNSVPEPGSRDSKTVSSRRRHYWHNIGRIGLQVSNALDYAHQQGVLHRDIKPSNLLLDVDGTTWVTDFGLAKVSDDKDLTMTGDVLGTLRFMAPERFNGIADARSDVDGLGITLYELVSFRRAFDNESREQLIRDIIDGKVSSDPSSLSDVPRDLATIIQKAMAVEPRARYETAAKMAEDLARYLANRPILSRRITTFERLRQWGRRNPVAAGFAMLAMCIFVLGFAGVTWKWQDAEHHRQIAIHAESETRRLLYVANMNMVQQAWTVADLPRVRELLNRQIPHAEQTDPRGFEWYYWWRLAYRETAELQHDENVKSVAYSQNGRLLASGSADGVIKLWDPSDEMSELASLQHPDLAGDLFLQFSPDSRLLASHARKSGKILIWDVATWRVQLSITTGYHEDIADTFAFLADSASIASLTGKDLTIWDIENGRARFSLTRQRPKKIAVSPDGRRLASFVGGLGVVLWDLETRQIHRTIADQHADIWSLAFSPNGKLLATGDRNRAVSIWNLENGQRLHFLNGHQYLISSLAFSPDGKLLASGSTDTTVIIWDVQKGERNKWLKGHSGLVQGVAWSTDGQTVASASDDDTVRLWKLSEAWEVETISRSMTNSHPNSGISIAVSNEGQWVAFARNENSIELRDLSDINRTVVTLNTNLARITSLDFSPDGCSIAAGSNLGQVASWEIASGKQNWRAASHEGRVTGLAYSPNGRHIASSGMDGTIHIFDEQSGQLLRKCNGHEGPVNDLAFHPHGDQLASAGADNFVVLWEMSSNERSRIRSEASVYTVAFSPNGHRLAFGGRDKQTTVWDLDLEKKYAALKGHTWYVSDITFSPDGQTLVSASHDSSVRLWDIETGEQKTSLLAHDDSKVKACRMTRDGKTLVSANENGTIRIWRSAY